MKMDYLKLNMSNSPKKIGNQFLQETTYKRETLKGNRLRWDQKPEIYKTYPTKSQFPLIKPNNWSNSHSLKTILLNRKSKRNYSKKSVRLFEFSYLLWASTGISRKTPHFEFRTAPSAGALYPIETYLILTNKISVQDQETKEKDIKAKNETQKPSEKKEEKIVEQELANEKKKKKKTKNQTN